MTVNSFSKQYNSTDNLPFTSGQAS